MAQIFFVKKNKKERNELARENIKPFHRFRPIPQKTYRSFGTS